MAARPVGRKRRAPKDKRGAVPVATVPHRHLLVLRIALIAITVLTFFPVLGAQFTNWDDDLNVTANPFVQHPDLTSLRFVWSNPVHHLYIPMVYTSLMLDQAMGGGAPWVFHLTNLLLHLASVLLVFEVLRVLLPLDSTPVGRLALAVGALVFAVHPLQTETVAWVTGRKDLLSTFFALTGMLFYFRHTDMRRPLYWGALVAFVLALLCKPAAVALPVGLAAVDVLHRRRPVKATVVAVAPFLAAGLLFALVTSRVQVVPQWFIKSYPLWWRPFIATDAICFYAKKLAVPSGLVPVYARVPDRLMQGWWVYASLPVLVVAMVAVARAGRIWLAALGFTVGVLLPVLGLVPYLYLNYSTVADHYMYLPMFGMALAAAYGFHVAALRFPARLRMLAAGTSVILIVWLVLAHLQTGIWHDSLRLWSRSVAVQPSIAEEHHNYGQVLLEAGCNAEAVKQYEMAVQLEPDFSESLNALGLEQMKQGKLPEAIEYFDRAIASNRHYGFKDERLRASLNNKAAALLGQKRLLEARPLLEEVLALDPNSWQALTNLGIVLGGTNDPVGAKRVLERALELNPDHQKARDLMGMVDEELRRRAQKRIPAPQ